MYMRHFGLSKVERPILDHHTKAHNLKSGRFCHEIWQISPEIWWNHVKSTQNLINSDVSAKTLQFGWISPEICQISCEIERPLARNCNPMFFNFSGDNVTILWSHWYSLFWTLVDSALGFKSRVDAPSLVLSVT